MLAGKRDSCIETALDFITAKQYKMAIRLEFKHNSLRHDGIPFPEALGIWPGKLGLGLPPQLFSKYKLPK